VSTFLTILSETGQPPRCEEGLRTFTFEKLVPGGIAEVSPLHDPAGEGQEAPGCGRGSNAGPEPICLWILLETIVIMKASVIPRDRTCFNHR
jgi:hypothetical protein